MRYLCSSIDARRMSLNFQNQMVDKAISKVDNWTNKTVSQAGKLVLLNSIMNSVPVHTLSTSWINEKVIEKYKSISKKFLWQSSVKKKAFHFLSWDKVTANKASDGLGVRDLSLVRYSLLAKRILPFLNKSGSLWSKLLSIQLLKEGLQMKVGNGEDISIIRDPWVSCTPLGLWPTFINTEKLGLLTSKMRVLIFASKMLATMSSGRSFVERKPPHPYLLRFGLFGCVSRAKAMNYKHLRIFSDCLRAINILNGVYKAP
ncbi:ribonuclease H protein [Canna indica]|uniref:Ribonuclease H protein n=1 Tax=Canna indica TaxID=4628 RepID=A0AAQ3Q0U7_9LILI|nr:ribonuclease H protein [Canna indica]